ncbi:undecaprenyl/decaprenyl-phosphate alpha-N-acetylglucosaminyl 1-phosphate transferase [Bdellovibrio sp. qaytius]|nr:undecaprenyl/decaprenyl-phosphate alpha-N-acetylglucosaminyl 1-phosphate transferase [Bdellovibrio sp. qaytius]
MYIAFRELFNNYIFLSAFAFALAFAIAVIAIPAVIRVAELKHLFDEPDDHRKTHVKKTPTLGGIAIFAGLIISFCLLKDFQNLIDVKYLVPALTIIFFAGVKDDILVLTPLKKLLAQFVCAFLIVFLGNIKINSFYGMFGLQEMPGWVAVVFTMLAIITIINCYNLIDGADGLAGSQGLVSALAFGVWFVQTEHWSLAFLSFALAGSLFGFLFFNWQPAKIFMGDTGAMVIGFVLSVLAIHFIELNKALTIAPQYWVHASTSVAIGVMAIPIFDMLRVFALRIMKRQKPFHPDRTHLHHLLIDLGFSHRKLSTVLFVWSLTVILVCSALRDYKSSTLLFILIGIVFIPSMILLKLRNNKVAKSQSKSRN